MTPKIWAMDSIHPNTGFSMSHFLITKTTGYFSDFNGATVLFNAKAASVFTDNKQRDRDLKLAIFLNAAKYPELTFKGLIQKDNDQYLRKSNPAIRNVNHPVILEVSYNSCIKDSSFHVEKAGSHITIEINRPDYGVLLKAAAQL